MDPSSSRGANPGPGGGAPRTSTVPARARRLTSEPLLDAAQAAAPAPTNFAAFVTASVARMTRGPGSVDQRVLRQCLGLASSYLVTDATMDPGGGIASWSAGFNRLVDLLVALHHRGELELDTVSAASKACSECWTVAGNWRELGDAKEDVRAIAVRLKGVLDENGRTYGGERVYVP